MAKVSLRAYNREIETMIDRGQLDEAIAHCHHILKTFPKNLDTYRLLGKAYLESKRYGDAADIFLRILASVPNDFVAQVGMSIIRDEENKLDDAIWHMERAFETQPSNPAIQSELQRLYGRRDGVQPPRIRMTRGALAHMYVQGELYPQAISEIKSVLKDDAGRADMQALLARACYKSGAKNEAAEVASVLLRRYPYSFDANRVLAEILGADHPENAQLYRQRVIELDPYAAQVTGTMFQSDEVPEAAVPIERLDWNGQPVSMQSDWGETRAISLESGMQRDEQPEWLKNSLGETKPSIPAQPTPASIFETTPSQPAPAKPAEEIPDFLRAAGWGQSTGTFDESKAVFNQEESSSGGEPIAQGDLPDWVKAMKPPEESAPAPQAEEEALPDWINNLGKEALPSATSDQMDWLSQPPQAEQPSAVPSMDQPDWLKGVGEPEEPVSSSQEQPDWLKSFASESDVTPEPAQTETPDWLKGLGNEPESAAAEPASQQDWTQGLGEQPETVSSDQSAQPDWLKDLSKESQTPVTEGTSELDWFQELTSETPVPEPSSTDFDFLNQLTKEPVLNAPEEAPASEVNTDNLGVSEPERDDSFAWLESLAAKQGATEGLLTKPEERREEEPDWVKQARESSSTTPPTVQEPAVAQSAAKLEDLGKTEQEQDDSFAWLENLAAKQGATEGLLTKPEERREEEPEWVKQAKEVSSQPSQPAPASASIEDLGKSEEERDDSFAWLENLAAKQGATEGLLTKPEERREEEPDWVKQAKDLSTQQPAVTPEPQQPAALDETGMWLRNLEETEKPVTSEPSADETAIWLRSLEEEKPAEAEPAADETAMWLKNLEAEKVSEPEPTSDDTDAWLKSIEEEKISEFAGDETATWLRNLEEEKPSQPEPAADQTAMWLKSLDQAEPAEEPVQPAETELPAWMQDISREETPIAESPVPAQEPQPQVEESTLEEENIPSWLAELDQEEERPVAADDDLPAWLRAEEAPPAQAEPTRASDWKHIEEKQPEIVYSPPLEEPKQPEIIYSPSLEETEQPAPEAPAAEPVQEEPKREPEPVLKAPTKPVPIPQPYREPATTRRSTGMLVTPTMDPILGSARNELTRSNIPGALESYSKLIKKGRYLDEVIYDLREALYRYPVEVSIWQSLGDAYMRSNRLQDALDAYTKAEELLR